MVAFNAGHQPHACRLPHGREWFRLIDTQLEAPLDMAESDEDAQLIIGESYTLSPYSCIVLKSYEDSGAVGRAKAWGRSVGRRGAARTQARGCLSDFLGSG